MTSYPPAEVWIAIAVLAIAAGIAAALIAQAFRDDRRNAEHNDRLARQERRQRIREHARGWGHH